MPKIIDMANARSALRYALAYAERGWHVFPVWGAKGGKCGCGVETCKQPGKHPVSPLVRSGMSDATTDPDTIRRWWGARPDAGVAISLAPSGLVAVDVDPRNDGYLTLEILEDDNGRLETDLIQYTQGGGEHRFFYLEPGSALQLPGKLGKGVDLKRNGYSVVPPTQGPQGVYAWETSGSPLDGAMPAPLPDWIRGLAAPLDTAGQPFAASKAGRFITEAQVTELRSALTCWDADDRDEWLRALQCLQSLGSVGWVLADEWSQQSAKYDARDQVRVWRSVQGHSLNYETIFWKAIERGWVNPHAAGVPVPAESVQLAPPPPKTLPPPDFLNTIPGVLGEGVQWILETAKKPQVEYAVPAMLAIGSVVLGRRFVTEYDNWSSLYFLAIGKTATGKESIKTAIEEVLHAAELDRLIAPDRYSSESAGFSVLETKPCHVSIQDEFGKLLQAARSDRSGHARSSVRFLLEAWGRAGGTMRGASYSTLGMKDQEADEVNNRAVHNPSVTLVGLSTPSTFAAGLSRDAVEDGFLNRMLISVCDSPRTPMEFKPHRPPPASLVDWCKARRGAQPGAGNLSGVETPSSVRPTPTVVHFGRGVQEMFFGADGFEGWCLQQMDRLETDQLGELFARSNEQSLRLAMVVALSDGSETIQHKHAQWAIEYARHSAEQMAVLVREHMHEGDYDAAWKDIARLVSQSGARGLTRREITQRSRYMRKLAEISPTLQDRILARMGEDGVIQAAESAGVRGRKRVAYVWVDSGE